MAKFSLDNSFGYTINRTAMRLKQELHRAFKEAGHNVTPEQWAVLNRLWEEDGLSQVELADRTFKDRPNMTRMIDVLERRELVERRENPEDRRAYKVHLTEAGWALKDQLIPIAQALLQRGRQNIEEAEIRHVTRILNQMSDNLD